MLWLALFLAVQLTPRTAADFRQPQLAASSNAVVATFGSGQAIYFSRSRDGGKTWGEPIVVTENAGALSLGNHRGPRVVMTNGATIISVIAGKQGKGTDGDLLTWRSTDGGTTWKPGPRVSDQAGAAREGLHAMAALPDGRLFATWLDLRNLKAGHPGTELWGAYSTDAGLTWSKNAPVYRSPSGSICQCCHPSALFTADGQLLVMWRNELAGNRDMYVIRSADNGRTFNAPAKLGAGSWALNACPMDGGSLAQNGEGKIVSVWRREKRVYLAMEGGAEQIVAEGKNPAMVAGKGGVYVAWNSPTGLYARVPGHSEPELLDPEGQFATLTAVPGGGVVAAWERKGTIQFHTLP